MCKGYRFTISGLMLILVVFVACHFIGSFNASRRKSNELQMQQNVLRLMTAMDADSDQQVSKSELQSFMEQLERRHLEPHLEHNWQLYADAKEGIVRWWRYRRLAHNLLDGETDQDRFNSPRERLRRERRRWLAADCHLDGRLDHEEFRAFLIPDCYSHMHEVVALEVMERLDNDNNQIIEYSELSRNTETMMDVMEMSYPHYHHQEILRREFYAQYGLKGMNMTRLRIWLKEKHFEHHERVTLEAISMFDLNNDGRLNQTELVANSVEFNNLMQQRIGLELLNDALTGNLLS